MEATRITVSVPHEYQEAIDRPHEWSKTAALYYKGFIPSIMSDDPIIADIVKEKGIDWIVENQAKPWFAYVREYSFISEYYVGPKLHREYAWLNRIKFVGGNNDTMVEALLDHNFFVNGGKAVIVVAQ